MVAVKLLRTVGVLQEEYGRIRFDGQNLHYEGLSWIFVKHLELGIMGSDHRRYLPEEGLEFLKSLKNHFSQDPSQLQAIDVVSE